MGDFRGTICTLPMGKMKQLRRSISRHRLSACDLRRSCSLVWWLVLIALTLPCNTAGAQALQPAAPPPTNTTPTPVESADTSKAVSKAHPAVEMIPLGAPAKIVDRKSSYTFKVTNSEWMDTGVQLAAGDHVEWSASGTMTISDGREVTADGLAVPHEQCEHGSAGGANRRC
jgi:hypothetical protein